MKTFDLPVLWSFIKLFWSFVINLKKVIQNIRKSQKALIFYVFVIIKRNIIFIIFMFVQFLNNYLFLVYRKCFGLKQTTIWIEMFLIRVIRRLIQWIKPNRIFFTKLMESLKFFHFHFTNLFWKNILQFLEVKKEFSYWKYFLFKISYLILW